MIHETRTISPSNTKDGMFKALRGWTDGVKYVINHNDCPVELGPSRGSDAPSEIAFTGSDSELTQWVKDFPHKYGAIYVVSRSNVVYDMNELRPGLEFFEIMVNGV